MHGIFGLIRKFFILIGVMADKVADNDAMNSAVIERGIQDSKARADKASYANGQLAGQIALLKDQIKKQEKQKGDVQGMLQYAASVNDENNGAVYAEQLANVESDLSDNKIQLENLELMYKENNQIIAEGIRQIQKFQTEFNQLKLKASMSKSMESLATMMKSSITELQGMVGGEISESMQKLRQSAANGEGQIRATMDLAKEMGSSIKIQQEAKKARGAMLFNEYKKKIGIDNKTSQNKVPQSPEKEKIKV